MRKVLAILVLLCAFAFPAGAVDYPRLEGRVIDEAHLLDDGAKRALENRLANLEAHADRQLIVVTLASARGMTVDDYGLALRKQWGLEVDGRRVMLIVGSTEGRSVIQYDNPLRGTLTNDNTTRILEQVMKPRFNTGDFRGGVIAGADELIGLLQTTAPQRLAQNNDVTVPATADYPALSGRVVDEAGILDSSVRESLRVKLATHEAQTGNQVVVATVKSLRGNTIEDYANRLFRRWQLGQRGKNNGVLLLHAPAERKIRIEVGYGLEGTLTDAIAKFIIANAITPRFKANDFGGGLTRGVDDIIKVLSGDEEFKQRASPPARTGWPEPLFFFIGIPMALFLIYNAIVGGLNLIHEVLVMLGLAQRRPRKGFWHGVDNWSLSTSSGSHSSSSSSWSSSSSSSGDSFSGGGGDSGGGGSSGDY